MPAAAEAPRGQRNRGRIALRSDLDVRPPCTPRLEGSRIHTVLASLPLPLFIAAAEHPSPIIDRERTLKTLIARQDIKKLAEEEPGFEEAPLGIYELLLSHCARRVVESDKPIKIGLRDDEFPELTQIRKTVTAEPESEVVRKLKEARVRWQETGSHLYLTEGFESEHYSYRAPRLTRGILEEVVSEERRRRAA